MNSFGFGPQSAQPLQQPQAVAPAAMPQQPMGAAQDPQSQYLTQMLAQMGKQQQGSTTGVAENLLASALMQQALKNQQQQSQQGRTTSQNAPIDQQFLQGLGVNGQGMAQNMPGLMGLGQAAGGGS